MAARTSDRERRMDDFMGCEFTIGPEPVQSDNSDESFLHF